MKKLIKKVLGLGVQSYSSDNWNKLAMVTFPGTCVATALSDPILPDFPQAGARTIRSFLALAVWVQMLAYLRGFTSVAPYVRMLFEIIHDLRAFLLLYMVIVVGFAHALLMHDEALRGKSLTEAATAETATATVMAP